MLFVLYKASQVCLVRELPLHSEEYELKFVKVRKADSADSKCHLRKCLNLGHVAAMYDLKARYYYDVSQGFSIDVYFLVCPRKSAREENIAGIRD